MVGHFTDSDVVLDFLAAAEHPRLTALGTSCPDHFLRTKIEPLVLDLPTPASVEDSIARLRELHAAYREDYQAYYDRNAVADSPAIRGADPLIVLVPGRRATSATAHRQRQAPPAARRARGICAGPIGPGTAGRPAPPRLRMIGVLRASGEPFVAPPPAKW
jgi:rhamnose utilization protein RhaD (predicted bifunctional aldolase and dehydrogenase)